MGSGFNTAFSEITLVLFTTLAPSGACALAIMALVRLLGRLQEDAARRVDKWLCVPLVVAMVGLVASATHLGNPANALYVFLGVGRSPLSTEVFCAVLFLLFAGVYWLYSFSLRPLRWLQGTLLVLQVVTAAVFVTAVAFAYDADTVTSWSTAYVPLGLWLNALVGGPVVALVALRAAQWSSVEGGFKAAMVALSGVALSANVAVFIFQGVALGGMENSLVRASELVPLYWPMLASFAACAAAGIAVAFRKADVRSGIGACALLFIGVFVMRFSFYMMHMTAGGLACRAAERARAALRPGFSARLRTGFSLWKRGSLLRLVQAENRVLWYSRVTWAYAFRGFTVRERTTCR